MPARALQIPSGMYF